MRRPSAEASKSPGARGMCCMATCRMATIGRREGASLESFPSRLSSRLAWSEACTESSVPLVRDYQKGRRGAREGEGRGGAGGGEMSHDAGRRGRRESARHAARGAPVCDIQFTRVALVSRISRPAWARGSCNCARARYAYACVTVRAAHGHWKRAIMWVHLGPVTHVYLCLDHVCR